VADGSPSSLIGRSVNESAFIGVDLAWRGGKRRSGVAVLKGDRRRAELNDIAVLGAFEEIVNYIDRHSEETTFVAVDAPLVIVNEQGQRTCENQIGRHYGAFGASCHSSNLSIFPKADSVQVTAYLLGRDFKHFTSAEVKNKVLLEVYPHPATIELFGLSKIIKYKKGKRAEKILGQKMLREHIAELSKHIPPLKPTTNLSNFLKEDLTLLRGKALKENEDRLDAIICAYIAYHCWYWGISRTHVFGDEESGYIVVPCGGSECQVDRRAFSRKASTRP
jgi:predicted RNase H-like nuclease